MSFATSDYLPDEDDTLAYRPLSSAAVVSLVLGLLSVVAFFDWSLLAVPMLGTILGIYAFRLIRSRQEEMTGDKVALLGTMLSAGIFLSGLGYHMYAYATEVPDGYNRIDYSMLATDPNFALEPVPRDALKLDETRVFIKGYPLPGTRSEGIERFILCRDRGECCFGGNPKPNDQILVQLPPNLAFSYHLRLMRVAGTFHVHPPQPGEPPGQPCYYLEADFLK
jgi:hypothetical protein